MSQDQTKVMDSENGLSPRKIQLLKRKLTLEKKTYT